MWADGVLHRILHRILLCIYVSHANQTMKPKPRRHKSRHALALFPFSMPHHVPLHTGCTVCDTWKDSVTHVVCGTDENNRARYAVNTYAPTRPFVVLSHMHTNSIPHHSNSHSTPPHTHHHPPGAHSSTCRGCCMGVGCLGDAGWWTWSHRAPCSQKLLTK